MTVSVIIPCYNNAPFVAEAIESALSQGGADIEVIVIDDGSTDNSAEVVRRFSQVRLISQVNKGVSFARNVGARHASGSYLIFLDADDRLAQGAVQAHLHAFEQDLDRVFVFGVCDIIDDSGRVINRHRQEPSSCDYWDILLGITPNPSQCMVRRAEYDAISGFDERLAYGEDWECFLRLSRTGGTYCHGHVVADYRKHATQSTRRPSKILSNMLQIIDDHCSRYALTDVDKDRFRKAKLHYTRLFGKWIPGEVIRHVQRGRFVPALSSASLFFSTLPHSAHGLYGFVRSRQKRSASR